jgi:Cys-tRNA(Pro)/Cys-tRNA(Cys) deacylase
MKTNAARLLDKLKVQYELREYTVDPEDLTAQSVATKIGFPCNQVFKTLAAIGNKNGVLLAVVPGDTQLDLKAIAKVSGNSDVKLAPLKDVEHLTGYIRGGITALACKKPYPVYVHESILEFPQISISAGQRGTQIIINPKDYVGAVNGTIALIAKAEAG